MRLALSRAERYRAAMRNDVRKKAALAAVILLAPGGFILAAALTVKHIRKRAERAEADSPVGTDATATDTKTLT